MTCFFSVEETYMYITPSMANVFISNSTEEAVHKIKTRQKLEFASKGKADLFCVVCVGIMCITEESSKF